jgi:hypothetical protein
MNDTPKYKRQRVNYEYMEKENVVFFDQFQQTAQVPYENNINNKYLSSPTQELGHIDELFNWLDGEDCKSNKEFSPFDAFNIHEYGLLTPTMTEINFF